MRIRELSEDDKPREKLLNNNHLTNSELLAILIQQGYRNKSCVVLAQEVFQQFGENLNTIASLTIPELCRIKGIGEAKACLIKAAFILSERLLAEPLEKVDLSSPKKTVNFVRTKFSNISSKEEVLCLSLDKKNCLINTHSVSIGLVDRSLVHAREIFRWAIHSNASSIILVHNHPSGDVQPSQADIEVTKKMLEVGKLLQIDFLDHIIVSGKINSTQAFYSLREQKSFLF